MSNNSDEEKQLALKGASSLTGVYSSNIDDRLNDTEYEDSDNDPEDN